jgi:hypothetical protein
MPALLTSLQLTLNFHIRQDGVPSQDQGPLAKSALDSMLELPVLKTVGIVINRNPEPCKRNEVEFHRMATNVLSRLTSPRTEPRSGHFRFMDLPPEIQTIILREHTHLVASGPVIASELKGYALDDCYAGRCGPCRIYWDKTWCNSSKICWSLPADLFLVNRHVSAISAQIFFSCNEFVVDLRRGKLEPLPQALVWSPSAHTGRDDASSPGIPGHWCPERSQFLRAFPPECIPMLRFVIWRFPMHDDRVALSEELEADWVHAVDFIAQNVKPLSRLTITLDMCDRLDDIYGWRYGWRRLARDKVMHPLCKLKDLQYLRVHISQDRRNPRHAAEELRLERLAMGEGYHPTGEGLGAHEA